MNQSRQRIPDSWALIDQLWELYRKEGIDLPYTMENFRCDYARQHFKEFTTKERVEILQDLPAEKRLELLQKLPAEERLAGLSREELEDYLNRLPVTREPKPSTPGKGRRKPKR